MESNALGTKFICYLETPLPPCFVASLFLFCHFLNLCLLEALLNRSGKRVAQGDSKSQVSLPGCSHSAVPVSCLTSLFKKSIPSLFLDKGSREEEWQGESDFSAILLISL